MARQVDRRVEPLKTLGVRVEVNRISVLEKMAQREGVSLSVIVRRIIARVTDTIASAGERRRG